MTKIQAENVYKLYRSGHRVMINSAWLDDFARLWKNEAGDIMIASQFHVEVLLTSIDNISMYKEVDWK